MTRREGDPQFWDTDERTGVRLQYLSEEQPLTLGEDCRSAERMRETK